MLAQHARRTRLKTSDSGAPLAEVVDGRLAQHGIDTEKISWDAFRREDGTWRIVATWPSGKATAQAIWDLDKGRQVVSPHDDMAQYLCAERPTQILGQEPVPERSAHERGGHGLPGPSRSAEPARGGHGLPAADRRPHARAATRSGPAATRCWPRLDRPLGPGSGPRPGAGRAGDPAPGGRRRRGAARRRLRFRLRRRLGPAQGGAGGAVARGAAPPPHGGPGRAAAGATTEDDEPSPASACRAGTTSCSAAARRPASPPESTSHFSACVASARP